MESAYIKSPFKFLDPFEKEDKDFFFGRKTEVERLHDYVNKNRIVLVYGQSGTGKTSIIKCGLANRFDITDWTPIFIRRGENIHESILTELSKLHERKLQDRELKGLMDRFFSDERNKDRFSEDEKKTICKIFFHLERIAEDTLTPIYLIFDQFEEVLILADERERKFFLRMVKLLLTSRLLVDCHIIIVMREEFFAWLDEFEIEIPGISDRRLRIEPMRKKTIQEEVVIQSCEKFNIRLDDSAKNSEQIVDAIATSREEVALPYLQVYMDQLWRHVYLDTYNGNLIPENIKNPELKFQTKKIEEFGHIGNVLERFLIERKAIIQKGLNEKFPQADPQLVNRVLDVFVNDQGTKRPIQYKIDGNSVALKGSAAEYLQNFKKEELRYLLVEFTKNQILRTDGTSYELAHDILARLIDQQRDSRQKRLNGIRVMVALYMKQEETIPYSLIKTWQEDIKDVGLDKEETRFYKDSKTKGEKSEREEFVKNEIKKVRKGFALGIAAAAILLLLVTVILAYKRNVRASNDSFAAALALRMDTFPDKLHALWIAKSVYDRDDISPMTRQMVQERMLHISEDQSIVDSFARSTINLKSSSVFLNGFDIDMSGDGKFIAVRNDSGNAIGTYTVMDVRSDSVLETFDNINYAFFLNGTDTLLLGFTDSGRNVLGGYSDKFQLYDCINDKVVRTVILKNITAKESYLYDKAFLSRHNYSDLDSYKIRMTKKKNLIIPYFTTKREWGVYPNIFAFKDTQISMLIHTTSVGRKIFETPTPLSISLSKGYDKIFYAVQNNGERRLESINDGERKPFKMQADIDFADYSETGSILYSRGKDLFVGDESGRDVKRYTFPETVYYAYCGGDEQFVAAELENNGLCLLDRKAESNQIKCWPEKFVAVNFKEKILISLVTEIKEKRKYHRLVVKDFAGVVKHTSDPFFEIYGTTYNAAVNNYIIKGKKHSIEKLQVLYLLDGQLKEKGAFYLTPNDCYDFSKDGSTFYFVRDNKLTVYDNKKFMDISQFGAINKWLDDERKRMGELKYRELITDLNKKYGIEPFPTERSFF